MTVAMASLEARRWLARVPACPEPCPQLGKSDPIQPDRAGDTQAKTTQLDAFSTLS
jgi:hypothetical protein